MSKTFSLPPDLVVGQDVETAADLWHLPESIWEKIWNKGDGSDVTVAVLDTGMTAHPDLPTPMAEKSFIRGQQVRDGNGHGSHCCGTSVGRNGLGVAPGAKLIVGKVLADQDGGSNIGIGDGIRWAADQGADVISLSLGGGGFDNYVREAIVYAIEKGCVVVCAAGNAGFNGANSIDYPGKYIESLCVGAFRSDGSIARFSSGGREVDVACPGQDIVSASHRGSGYVSMSGTSMATPFFAGLVALIISLQRREGHAEMRGTEAWRKFLENFTEDAGQPGKDERFGYGIPRSSEIVESLAADDVTMMGGV